MPTSLLQRYYAAMTVHPLEVVARAQNVEMGSDWHPEKWKTVSMRCDGGVVGYGSVVKVVGEHGGQACRVVPVLRVVTSAPVRNDVCAWDGVSR